MAPWQAFAAALLTARRRWYRTRARRLPAGVISVGNLHLGGTGKTPLTAAIAKHLCASGLTVTILSRGYKRTSSGIVLVSRGDGLLTSPAEVGDEPALLAEALDGVSIVVGEDRYEAGLWALSELDPRPQVFLLDDGFSHLRLARDLDLLAFPASDPWGNGRLAPTGPLREPLAATAHADAAILTGAGIDDEDSTAAIAAALARHGFGGGVFNAATRVRLRAPLPDGASGPQLLVTGIARPERVVLSAAELGLEIAEHIAFPDHHPYPRESLDRIQKAADRNQTAGILTTAKDAVKLAGRTRAALSVIDVLCEPELPFWEWLDYAGPMSKSGSPPSTD